MPDDDDLDAELERLEQLSDEEVLAEAAAAGVDVPAQAARVRAQLIDAIREVKAGRPPRRFVVDDVTGARIADRLANPREPSAALRELFHMPEAPAEPGLLFAGDTGSSVPEANVLFWDRANPVLIAAGPAGGGALRAALMSTAGRPPELLVVEPPPKAEVAAPIDVILPIATALKRPGARTLGRGGHKAHCQRNDRIRTRRGLPFSCICGLKP